MDRVLASTYRKAYRALPRLRNATRPGAWLSGLAAQACAEELRRQAQRRPSSRRTGPASQPPGGTRIDVSRRVDPFARDDDSPPMPALRPKPVELSDSVYGPSSHDEAEGDERVTLIPSESDDVALDLTEPVDAGHATDGPDEPASEAGAAGPTADVEWPGADQPGAEAEEPPAGASPDSADGSGDDDPAAGGPAADVPGTDAAEPVRPVEEAGEEGDPVDITLDLDDEAGADGAAAEPEPGPGSPPVEQLTLPGTPPAHLPGFWNRLGRQLIAEREIPARPAPTVEQIQAARAATNADRPEPIAGSHEGLATPDRLVRLETPVTVEELAHRATGGARLGDRIRQFAVVLLAVVAIGTVVFLAFRIGGNAKQLNRTQMTDGKLASSVSDTLANSQSLTASFNEITVDGGLDNVASRLYFRSDGSFRLARSDGTSDFSYDATTGVRRTWSSTGGVVQIEQRGLAGGGPDAHAIVDSFFNLDLPLVLDALRAHPDTYVTSEKVQGKAVWRATVDLPHDSSTPDKAVLDVDQSLRVPVRLELQRNGKPVKIYAMGDVAIDPPLQGETFTIPFTNDPVQTGDEGFQHTSLSDVPNQIPGLAAPTPKFLPNGYDLAEVAVHPGAGGRTGPGQVNPPSTDVISLTYRKGWETITVTVRRNDVGSGQSWQDPFISSGTVPEADTVRISGGRFSGATAHRVSAAGRIPYLWGSTDKALFTVTGDLTPDELVRVISSVQ